MGKQAESPVVRFSLSPHLLVSSSFLLRVLCILCGEFFLFAAEAGAAPQKVVPVDGAPFLGELVSIDANGGATFRIGGGTDVKGEIRTQSLEQLVRWGNAAAPRPQTIVVLADGGRIMAAADWAGGAIVRLVGDDVLVASDSWHEVKLARGLVDGIVFAQQRRASEREKLVEWVRAPLSDAATTESKTQADTVLLTNGDRLTGSITELDRGSLAIETRGGVGKAPLSRVEAIVFGGIRQPSAVSRKRGKFVVGLRDGSLLYANAIRVEEKVLKIELANGVIVKGGAVDDVVVIQSLDGAVVYLSDFDGADYRGVPYLSVTWPFTRDRNVLGEPIEVRGRWYLKGIGMHSAARLTYRLSGDYRRFDSMIAIGDSAKGRGSVTFAVYVLRDGKWGEAFKSGILRGNDQPQPVTVGLTGAKGITLTVDFADRGDELDHAVWLDARLVK